MRRADQLAALLERMRQRPAELDAPPDSPRGRILAAASREFADFGLAGTSTRAIAEAADVNLAMIHYYFHSKEQLYVRVLAREFLNFWDAVYQTVDFSMTPGDLLPSIPVRVMSVMRASPPWAALMRREMADGGKHLVQAFRLLGEAGPLGLVDIFSAVHGMGITSGELRRLPSDPVRECIIAVMFGTMVLQPVLRDLFDRDLEDDAVWTEWSKTVMSVLKHGVAAEGR
ncbi:MAG: TetR family transcriptional regulator [bacterium]|nr:TetR family transcriptional regulator [bacterium]